METPAQEDLDAIREALEGRILFDHEIRRALQERGHPVRGPLEDALQVLTVRGLVGRAPSVTIDRFGIATCVRCGGHDIVEASCASCGSDECLRCVECASMGEARSCRPLYYAPGSPRVRQDQPRKDPRHGLESAERVEDLSPPPSSGVQGGKISLPFGLTKAQQDASRFLASFVTGDGPSECLVYAVCGAGKTEVCLEAVDLALRQGGRVLFAVPRSDVVAEVAPRVSTALPHARVVALRGASRERYRAADVVVATTHQTLRFYQAFDLVVLDEADAFPFRGSRMLRHALRRATVPHGKTIYMTATPDQSLLTAADQGRVALTRISARHHGRPLPVPAIVTVALPPVDERGALSRPPQPPPSSGNRHAAGMPSEAVATIEASLRAGHRVFVFVPTVGLAERVCNALEISLVSPAPAASPDSAPLVARPRVAFVHSRHPERDRLREAFKQGRIDVLVTTTIMERGINVPMADVVVLYADFDRVFDAGTLVQMAGRAGRSGEYPCARVHFVAERVSPAMRAAIASIRAMNEHAAAAGYLQKGSDPCL
ncbi:MAG: helicase-related protein [Clostridia bacterium]